MAGVWPQAQAGQSAEMRFVDEDGMSVKQIGLSGLCWLLCGLGWLHAQAPTVGPMSGDAPSVYSPLRSNVGGEVPTNPVTSSTGSGPLSSAFRPAPAGVNEEGIAIDEGNPPPPPYVPVPLAPPYSPYINYPHSPCCCGPIGKCGGPFGYDVFIRSGLVFPIGSSILDKNLLTGWDIEGGGRLYMFNPPQTAAWTGTLSVSNIFCNSVANSQQVLMFNVPVILPPAPNSTFPVRTVKNIPSMELSVRNLNMTFVNLGLGREWWLCGTADPGQTHGLNWKVGVDGGGRWGSAKIGFNEIQHKNGVVGGADCGIYSNIEYPFRCGIPFAGVRLEYNYIWTGLLQRQNPGDFQSLNLLFQLGVRF
ncbi:MAG TPA: hypothetical protein VH592_05250 [Gemmataceae bacterium]|jgi:hypothetical protein